MSPAESGAARAHAGFVARVGAFATRERIRSYTRLMAVIVAVTGILNAALGEGLLDRTGDVIGADFLAFYTGAKLYAEGRLLAAYDPGPDFDFPVQFQFQRELLAPQQPRGVHPFINPPYAVVLYLPFAFLSYGKAVLAWWVFGLAMLAAAASLLRRELPTLQRWSPGKLVLGSFLFFPTFGWLGYGQITTVTLLVYVGTFVLLRRGRDLAAGACLGCLAFKPQLALVLALVLLLARRWRAVAAGAVVLAAWQILGWWMDPAAMARYYGMGSQLIEILRLDGYPTWGVQSLLGFAVLLLDGISRTAADWLAALLSGGVLALLLWQWWRSGWQPASEGWDLLMAATFALGLIVSPHLFLYDLMLLLLPFGIVLQQRSGAGRDQPLGGGPLLAWTVVVWLLAFVGGGLSLAQQRLTAGLPFGPIALQLAPLAILAWGVSVLWLARSDAGSDLDPITP